jgi:transcriptional regulator with XRE-family HTH domain
MAAGKTTLSWLRVLRENVGHTQDFVAAVLGVTAAYASQVETGKRVLAQEKTAKLAALYGISEPDLAALEAGVTPNEVLVGFLRERGIDPNPPPSDEEIEQMTSKQLRAYLQKHDPTREELPEVWYELRRREEGGSDAYYEKQDPATHPLLKMVDDEGRVTVEQPPSWFVARMEAAKKERVQTAPTVSPPATRQPARARARERRDTRRSSTRGSPSDDDGESESGDSRKRAAS